MRQKYTKTVSDYLRWFMETRNRSYNLTIGEKDLANLAFAGLSPYLREKMDGQEFTDTNQLLQQTVSHENQAKDSRAYNRFKDNTSRGREKHNMNYIEGETEGDEDNKIYVAKWVEMPGDKPISCSFLKPNGGEEMR
jgi:hypothetical protein